jgi:hypothetical protein
MTHSLTALIIDIPEQDSDFAVRMSGVVIKMTQPYADPRDRMHPEYLEDVSTVTAVSQMVPTPFATIAAANGYRKDAQ